MKAEHNEKILLQELAKNNKKAAEEIYKGSYETIKSLIINNNGSSDDAKDVFQEAMIVLYEKVRLGNFELNCLIKTYLYAVSRRIWLKKLQHANRYSGDIGHVESTIMVDDDLEEHQRRDAEFTLMNEAIQRLGEPCKSLLEAFYLQKRPMQEIATSFGYTNAENAKTQKYKCLMRLKKIFFSQYKTGTSDERAK